jgi:hypothetical protein
VLLRQLHGLKVPEVIILATAPELDGAILLP